MLKRVYSFLLLSLFVLISNVSLAQYRLDYGVTFGPSNYVGDVGSGGDAKKLTKNLNRFGNVQWNETKYSIGAYGRYKFHPKVAGRLNFGVVRVEGDDKFAQSEGRRARNLNFKNNLIESSFIGEYYFYQSNDNSYRSRGVWRSGGRARKDFSAYAFTGVAGLYSNPKADYNGSLVKLQPLQTEGVKYGKFVFAIPVGIGVQYTINRQWKFGFELNYRHTFNDYLDDVSGVYKDPTTFTDPTAAALSNRRGELTDENLPPAENYGVRYNATTKEYEPQKRGDPKQDDTFMTSTFTVGYTLKGKNSFYKARYKYITSGKKRFKKRRGRAKF
ncbi:MAG: DUF6089 family protein [Bacteroidota bacterium]